MNSGEKLQSHLLTTSWPHCKILNTHHSFTNTTMDSPYCQIFHLTQHSKTKLHKKAIIIPNQNHTITTPINTNTYTKTQPFSCDLAAFSPDTHKFSKTSLWDEDQAQTSQNPVLKFSLLQKQTNLFTPLFSQSHPHFPHLPLLIITNPQQSQQLILPSSPKPFFTKHRTQLGSHMHLPSLSKATIFKTKNHHQHPSAKAPHFQTHTHKKTPFRPSTEKPQFVTPHKANPQEQQQKAGAKSVECTRSAYTDNEREREREMIFLLELWGLNLVGAFTVSYP